MVKKNIKRMKKIVRVSLMVGIIIHLSSCLPNKKITESYTSVLPLSDTISITGNTLLYGLPRTVLTFVVEAERNVEIPGPYAAYAEDLLGLDNVINNESEYWSIENISVMTSEELDPSEFYIIKCDNIFHTNLLSLKEEGLILDIDQDTFNRSKIGEGRDEGFNTGNMHFYDLGSDEYYSMKRDTAYRRINADTMFIRIPYIVERRSRYTVEELAERAAVRLMELREGKHLILTGETNVFPQNEAAINEINRMEKDYTELFTGKIWSERKSFIFQIIPETEMIDNPAILFNFSEVTGIVSEENKGGSPVYVRLTEEKRTKELNRFGVNVDDLTMEKYDRLYYRIPDMVNIEVTLGDERLYSTRRLIYQFGNIIQLPTNYIF
jgi:hypothetical protein